MLRTVHNSDFIIINGPGIGTTSAGTAPGVANRAGRKAGIHFPPAGSPAENGSRSNRIIAKFFSRLLK
jgi:hypothetical protein